MFNFVKIMVPVMFVFGILATVALPIAVVIGLVCGYNFILLSSGSETSAFRLML